MEALWHRVDDPGLAIAVCTPTEMLSRAGHKQHESYVYLINPKLRQLHIIGYIKAKPTW